jgi:hypothetical protein
VQQPPTPNPAEQGAASPEVGGGAVPVPPEGEPPAVDQAPVAHEAQNAIIGDPGFRNEQQPLGNEGQPTNVDIPVRTSAPPPSLQSGVPLPEDRAAGVEPGQPAQTPEADVPQSERA